MEEITGETITLRTVIRLIFEREFNGYEYLGDAQKDSVAGVFTEAVGRGSWHWIQSQYGTHTKTTIMNWVGAHNYVSKSMLNYLRAHKEDGLARINYWDETRAHAGNSQIANGIVSALFYPPDKWKAYDENLPYTFGFCNQSECLLPEGKREAFRNLPDTKWGNGSYQFTTDMTGMYFKWGDLYIITRNQRHNWYK